MNSPGNPRRTAPTESLRLRSVYACRINTKEDVDIMQLPAIIYEKRKIIMDNILVSRFRGNLYSALS